MGDQFGALAHFFARPPGRPRALLAGGRHALARLAADDVAEGFLEALGAPVGREPPRRLRLLLRPPLAIAPPRPGRVRLADPAGAVERDREEEEAGDPVQGAALEEADRDDGHEDPAGGDHRRHPFGFAAEVERVDADDHQAHRGRGDHRRVDRAAPLLSPVDVVEVDPERELVDRQAGADAEGEAADLRVGALAVEGEAERAGDHHRHDPEDQVVQVDAAVADDAARPPGHLRAAHQPRAHADEGEGEDEADQDEEDALAFVGEDVLVPEVGEDRGVDGGHAEAGAGEVVSTAPSSARPAAIRSRVSSTAAIANNGESTMLEADSAIQTAKKLCPSSEWTSPWSASATASPTSSTGTSTAATTQKLPRTSSKLRAKAPRTVRPSSSTIGPERPRKTKTRAPGTMKAIRPTITAST